MLLIKHTPNIITTELMTVEMWWHGCSYPQYPHSLGVHFRWRAL